MEEKKIKLFGKPEVTVDEVAITLGIEWPTLALFILWRHRGDVDVDALVDVLKPRSKAETDRASFIKKHKDTLRKRLSLTLPMTLKLTTLGPAILEQAWVDVVEFDAKIAGGDRREVEEAVALRQCGPLLVTLTEPDVFIKERAAREEKYQEALLRLIQEDRDSRPHEAMHFMDLLLKCDGLPESRKAFLHEERLKLEHEIFKSKPVREADKTTRSLPTLPLPNFPTELIGRETERVTIQELLHKPGLVTLIGPAGIGKTRLAAAVALYLREYFPGGAGWIDLAAAADADQIVRQMSAALGLMEQKERSQREALLTFLEPKNLLLVWDNCEHIAAECARLAEEVLRRCPEIRLLATSRETLHVYGERLFSVPVLPDSSAVALFVERAQAVNTKFHVTERNQASVQTICRELDGLPLALELAAGLLLIRTPKWIADNLHQRFDLLIAGARTESGRHASLRVAFDLSYDLLPLDEQALFRTLGVFAGSFGLEAAESVACFPNTAHLLSQLVRKSMVRKEENDQEVHFYLLVSLRQYAQDKLRAHEGYEGTIRRHRDYYLVLAEEAAPQLRGPDQKSWLDRLEAEHDNFREALSWRADESSVRLACALQRFWVVRGFLNEGQVWLDRVVANIPRDLRAGALIAAGRMAYAQGKLAESRTRYEQGLALSTEIGNTRVIADALFSLGCQEERQGNYKKAAETHHQGMSLYLEMSDQRGIADTLYGLGMVAQNQDQYQLARERFQESLLLRRELGDFLGIANLLTSLGRTAFYEGKFAAAEEFFQESLSLRQVLGEKRGIASSWADLADIYWAQADYERARVVLSQSSGIHEAIGDHDGEMKALAALADIAFAEGSFDEAEQIYRQVLAAVEVQHDELAVAIIKSNLGSVAREQGKLNEARILLEATLAVFQRREEKSCIANSLGELGLLAVLEKEYLHAVQLWSAEKSLSRLISYQRPPNQDARNAKASRGAMEALGEEAFARAWAEGQRMTWERAVAYALGGATF